MEQICAVIDVQGFQFSDRFVPREVAIISDKISQVMELDTKINWRELNEQDRAVVLYSTQEIHGLHFNPFNPKDSCFLYTSNEIGKIINIWYDMIATESKPLFAFKNQQLGKILSELEIPSFDLDDPALNIPPYEKIKEHFGDNYLCGIHKRPPTHKRFILNCAYRKANQLYRLIKESCEVEKVEDWSIEI